MRLKRDKANSKKQDVTALYDGAISNPWDFIGNLRSNASVDGFDPENMNKAAHDVAAIGFSESEIDIAKTIRSIVDSKIIVPRDMKIDDSGIPVAANVYDWCTKDRFSMINGERPYIEQLCWGVVAFNEYCPRCSDVEYLFVDHKVDDSYRKFERKVALLENGVCPHCKWGRSKLIKKKKMRFIQELAICAGQRSGKSLSVAGYFAPYLTHRLLKMQNPNAVYGLKTGTMLHCTFVALTYQQAKDTLWQNYYATLTESQWFREYHGMLKHYEEKYGEKLLKFNDTYVAYPSRGLMAYPAGPDKRVLRGRTRFFASIDEIAYFDSNRDTKKVKDNAHEVAGALDRSLLTVRGAAERLLSMGYDDVYPGYAMNVSSPVSRNDMIMTLVRRAENSSTTYAAVRPTWEVNPTLPRTNATITDAYKNDPIGAERDYGAVPPLVASPFLQAHTQIEDCQMAKMNPVKLVKRVKQSKKRGESYTWAEIKKGSMKKSKYPSIMAIDAGLTNNSFSGTIGRMKGLEVVADVVFEIQPESDAPLNHSLIYQEVLLPLMKARNVKILLADRWNSVKLLQDAKEDASLEIAEQYSLKYRDIHIIKTLVQQGTLRIPMAEREFKECIEFDDEYYPSCFAKDPAAHLIMQMATVKDTGKMVDKGDGYTDDIFRSLALLVWGLHQEDYQAILLAAPEDETLARPGAIAASKLYSGGGSSIGNGGMAASNGSALGISRGYAR